MVLLQLLFLDHKKARALISHGGYNSLQEAINAGIPIIAIPLFGDQPTNAKLAEKRHLGIVLQKNQISESVLTAAIKSILEDDRCSYFMLFQITIYLPFTPFF